MWKKARVEELKAGRDGATRTAILRGADGTILVRPIQLVIPLEVDQVRRIHELISDQEVYSS